MCQNTQQLNNEINDMSNGAAAPAASSPAGIPAVTAVTVPDFVTELDYKWNCGEKSPFDDEGWVESSFQGAAESRADADEDKE